MMPKRPYPSWQRRHTAIMLYLLEHLGAKNKDIATATGYSASQVSRIMCSPAFEEAYQTRFRPIILERWNRGKNPPTPLA